MRVPDAVDGGGRSGWRRVLAGAAPLLLPLLPWLVLVSRLMVVDVWDETRALAAATAGAAGGPGALQWAPSGAGTVLVRPVPVLLFSSVVHVVGEPDVAWRVLRWVGAVLVMTGTVLLVQVVRRLSGADPWRDAMLVVLLLYSGGGFITAGWFANLFDACTLAVVAGGLLLLVRGRPRAAGVALGVAFFCKEVAVLALPVVVVLWAAGYVGRRQALQALAVGASGGVLYLLVRTAVVVPGSARDVHGLDPLSMLATLPRLADAWWWETSRVPAVGVGAVVLLLVLLLSRSRAAAAGVAALLVLSSVLYAGMLGPPDAPLLGAATFSGRLFLVPVALSLLLLALDGRRWALAVVLPTVLWGATVTYDHHLRLQRAYERVYRLAGGADGVVTVNAPSHPRPFLDRRHGVRLGPFPDAEWTLEPSGELRRRRIAGPPLSGAGS